MPLLSLPQQTASEVVGEICQKCVRNMHNFINKSEKVYKDLLDVVREFVKGRCGDRFEILDL